VRQYAFLALIGLGFPALALSADAPPSLSSPSFARTAQMRGTESGFAIFQVQCTGCHGNPAAAGRAPDPATLRQMPPERIYAALTSGSMKVAAAGLTDEQKRHVAQFMSGRPLGSAAAGDVKQMTGRCASNPPLPDPASRPEWNGWGVDRSNSRYQPAAGLDAADVPWLTLKWAFGFPQGVSAFAQPTVVSGRVFVGSDIGYLYSLDAKSGCAYWSFEAQGSIRTATTVAPIKSSSGTRYAVYFGDSKANVYALDAQTGERLWSTKVDDHFTARVTGTPTVSGKVVYVPVSSSEELTASTPTYSCCSFRGSVVALDAATGQRKWKTYVIAQQPQPVRRNEQGTQLFAPAGASVWDSPTIDALRHALYVGTGDAETSPASPNSDAVMALDLRRGKVLWVHQAMAEDAWLGGCGGDHPPLVCPKPLGRDFDIGNSPILKTLPGGQRILVNATKDAKVFALDPDHDGALLWQVQVAPDPNTGRSWGVHFGGAADEENVYYPLDTAQMVAVELATGHIKWTVPLGPPGVTYDAAATVIRGAVFVGGSDGRLIALATHDGRKLWEFATMRSYVTVNGVPARGGSMGSAGPTLAEGMLFVGSGYGVVSGTGGNVLLAFAHK
jgi:polyvinyl alcohol dehydrogenase (cytochrome)